MSSNTAACDAVIRNRLWDRIKLHEPNVCGNSMMRRLPLRSFPSAERRQLVAERRTQCDSVNVLIDGAAEPAAQLSTVVRQSACDYPQLGRGDVNRYSLFVERSLTLLDPEGICGLLTPSGIYADKDRIDFLESISTNC